ncbi:CBS domain-containing protein [Sulfurirhabdus autotrophica]|uniref:CBS domain protein n=1 Tax=Sulfurirhabdus autotrophica TaxID=1706046 RepID=A0A4R3YE83_9PROT|nr:CBS domain-containing protein [Sulfurirhabdus autotrophica]TCV90386.1 CBS domain protein [Sulfurirhabdus autotrophica]
MAIDEICNREVVIASKDTTVLEASRLMRQYHTGDLVIVEEMNGLRGPIGIVTDRDLVIEVVAMALDSSVITIGDIMGSELAVVNESEGVFETMRYMRTKGVRRLPVVDVKGALVGIVTLDDLLELLAEEMNELCKTVSNEIKHESQTRSTHVHF